MSETLIQAAFEASWTSWLFVILGFLVASFLTTFLYIVLSDAHGKKRLDISAHFKMTSDKTYADYIPLDALHPTDPRMIFSGEHVVAVIALKGIDIASKSLQDKERLFNIRHKFLLLLEQRDLQYRLLVKREEKDFTSNILNADESCYQGLAYTKFAMAVVKRWVSQFTKSYSNRPYLILSLPENKLGEGTAKMSSLLDKAKNQLKEYDPVVLKHTSKDHHETLVGFWASLVNPLMNCFPEDAERPSSGDGKRLADQITACFPMWQGQTNSGKIVSKDGFIVFCRGSKEIWMAGLGLARWGTVASGDLWTELLSIDSDLWVMQWVDVLTETQSREQIKERRKAEANGSFVETFVNPKVLEDFNRLESVLSDPAAQEKMVYHQAAILVFSHDRQSLEKKMARLENLADDAEVTSLRFGKEVRSVFFSFFPPTLRWICKSFIKAENMAAMSSLIDTPVGQVHSGYGPRPITIFKTAFGSPYAFGIHARDGDPRSSGHVKMFARTDTGKSVATQFIQTNLLGFPNLNQYLLDRQMGAYVATMALGGDYIPLFSDMAIDKAVELNPLHMEGATDIAPEAPAMPHPNALWVRDWIFKTVCNLTDNDQEDLKDLERALSALHRMPKSSRNLNQLWEGVGHGTKLKRALERWADPSRAEYLYFNGSTDSLDFSKSRLTAFDVSRVDANLFRRFIPYLFRRILTENKKAGTPFLMVAEELGAYLKDPSFAAEYKRALEEWRKNQGAMFSVFQHPGQIMALADQEVRSSIITQIETDIVFPNDTWVRKDFAAIGYSEAEIDIITNRSPLTQRLRNERWVFMKRPDGYVILLIDLSSLGNLFKIYESSGDKPAAYARRLIENDPMNWVQEFINERL